MEPPTDLFRTQQLREAVLVFLDLVPMAISSITYVMRIPFSWVLISYIYIYV